LNLLHIDGNNEKIPLFVKFTIGVYAPIVNQLKDIGADGYDPTAPGAVKLARKLIEK